MSDYMQSQSEGMMKCPTCQQEFSSQDELDTHMRQEHDGQGQSQEGSSNA